ncbi:MAG: GNAT family N-acetyltransferase [Solirubrobacteraceae bacterium]|nr:GNAT family N-acetyltransferase [Solirubrobacteraceae bacterium]
MTAEPLGPIARLEPHHSTTDFESSQPSLDRWLRNSAATAAAAGTAATYVLPRGTRVVGYYALAMGAVAHEHAPGRLRRGMPDPVPVVLLARLALDRGEHGNGLGGHLLVDALRRCVRGANELGARAVVVDAIDDSASAFYEHFGFRPLHARRYWRRVNDIAEAIRGQS